MHAGKTKIETPLDSVWEKLNSAPLLAKLSRTIWPGVWFIVLATLAAYWPVYSAGFIWDDDDYVTNNHTLQTVHGLWEIWVNPKATPQYYPLVHTTFWMEYHLWGLNPQGFHIVNVCLQVMVALLLWRALTLLKVPGAWLAAAIFALHPVQVESVAWITERKNLLSAFFYLLAALAYGRFSGMGAGRQPASREGRYYAAALLLYVCALLSKTVACSLPAALLLVIWWKQGSLRGRDVRSLLPFFVVGLGLGLNTAWLEKTRVGAVGPEWALSFFDRCLIAGRALWFYATNLLWPAKLIFVYPRWTIDTGVWWQWLFPLAALGVLAALWLARKRIGRGPLTAVLFFAFTLAPALGFINVYPMRFSFVADHFQYLAAAGLITLAAVWLVRLPPVINGGLLLVYALLTFHQCGIYNNLEVLWRDTLQKNPACWMAHTNLGRLLVARDKPDEAQAQKDFAEAEMHYQAALAIDPKMEDIHYNYANLLAGTGRTDAALAEYGQAVELNPSKPDPHNNLGALLLKLHRPDEAIAQYQQAIRLDPDVMSYHYNLASALVVQHQTDAAIKEFQRALELAPDSELIKRRLRALGVNVY